MSENTILEYVKYYCFSMKDGSKKFVSEEDAPAAIAEYARAKRDKDVVRFWDEFIHTFQIEKWEWVTLWDTQQWIEAQPKEDQIAIEARREQKKASIWKDFKNLSEIKWRLARYKAGEVSL